MSSASRRRVVAQLIPPWRMSMTKSGFQQYPPRDQVIFGKPAGQALREEAERRDAQRVFLIVSKTLNTHTDEIEKIRNALGSRYAGTFDGVPQHTTRASAVEATARAAEAKADLIVAVGGGSVVDAAKIVLMCLEHTITDESGLDGFELSSTPEGPRPGPFRAPKVRMIAIPSTLSGGEYNSGTLVTDTRRKLKQTDLQPSDDDAADHHPRSGHHKIHAGKALAGLRHPRNGSWHRGDLLDPRQPAGRQRVSAGPAVPPRRLTADKRKAGGSGSARQLPVRLMVVGVRAAGARADGREPRHRPRARGHLRRAALFLPGGDDAERVAL